MPAGFLKRQRLLVDTNLLVLYVVGLVNRDRIESFDRTSAYRQEHFDYLIERLGGYQEIYTLPHIMAEVSNLAKLSGEEAALARKVVSGFLHEVKEQQVPSIDAVQEDGYQRLGLTDAAIVVAARLHQCEVLTDDLDLWLLLQDCGIPSAKFTHELAAAGLV